MEIKFKVVFHGDLAPGVSSDAIVKNLPKIFGLSGPAVAKLLSNPPSVLKRGLDRNSAMKYRAALRKAGLVCRVEPMDKRRKSPGTGPLSASGEKAGGPDHERRKKPKRENDAFDVVFDGKIVKGFDQYTMKQNVAGFFKTDFKKIHELLTPRPAIVKKNVNYSTAERFKAVLNEAGAQCRIVPTGTARPLFPDVSEADSAAGSPSAGDRNSSANDATGNDATKTGETGNKVVWTTVACLAIVCVVAFFSAFPRHSETTEPRATNRSEKTGGEAAVSKTPETPAAETRPANVEEGTPKFPEDGILEGISPSEFDSVTDLDLSFSQAENIHALRKLPRLEYLDLSSTPVSDISPLADLPKLKYLNLSSTPVEDFTPLSGLLNMVELDLSQTSVGDLGLLKNSINLRSLNLSGSMVADLRPLARLPMLERLFIRGAPVADLEPLMELKSLTYLELGKGNYFPEQIEGLRAAIPGIEIAESGETDDF